MCDPFTIGALAVSAAGQAISGYERNQTASEMTEARNAATRAELGRQKVYGEQSQAEFKKSTDLFDPANQAKRLGDEQKSVGDLFANNAPTADKVGSIGTGNGPRVVADTEKSKLADAFKWNAGQGNALSKVAGYDQRFFDNNVDLNANARDIDRIGDFAKTSASVNGVEQRAAYNNAFRPPSGIGDLLSFAGSAGAFGAGKGWFGGSGGFTPSVGTPRTPVPFYGVGASPY